MEAKLWLGGFARKAWSDVAVFGLVRIPPQVCFHQQTFPTAFLPLLKDDASATPYRRTSLRSWPRSLNARDRVPHMVESCREAAMARWRSPNGTIAVSKVGGWL